MNCQECLKTFSSKDHLRRHRAEQHSSVHMLCEICRSTFSNKRKLVYHQNKFHNVIQFAQVPNPSPIYEAVPAKRIKMNDEAADDEEYILCNISKVNVLKHNIFNHKKSLH